jgi:hypothetical protein
MGLFCPSVSLSRLSILLPSICGTTNYMFCHIITRERLSNFLTFGMEVMSLEAGHNSYFVTYYHWWYQRDGCSESSGGTTIRQVTIPMIPSIIDLRNCWCCNLSVATWITWHNIHRKTDDVIAPAAIYYWSYLLFFLQSIGGLAVQYKVLDYVVRRNYVLLNKVISKQLISAFTWIHVH